MKTCSDTVGPDHDDWEELLSSCEFAVKNAYQDSIRTTPFLLNYGQNPRVAAQAFSKVKNCPSAEKMTVQMQQDLQAAKECLKRAQQRQKEYANSHRRELEFDVGDKVYLSTKNIKLRGKGISKLRPKYTGPYEIVKKVSPVAYTLAMPKGSRIHPTFHVSLLEKYLPDPDRKDVKPEPLIIDAQEYFLVEKIIDHEDKKMPGKKATRRYLVRWKDYPPSEDTWEPENYLKKTEALSLYWHAQQAKGTPFWESRERVKKPKRTRKKTAS